MLGSRKILVTGGSGFIGTNVIQYYLNRRVKTLSLDIARPKNKSHEEYWRMVDILDFNNLLRHIEEFQPTELIHLAARTDLQEKNLISGYSININGVRNIIRAINAYSKIERTIFASSMLVCETGCHQENYDDYKPSTLYGESKVLAEKIIKENTDMATTWTIVRPTSIWGPWFSEPYRSFFNMIIHRKFFYPGRRTATRTYGFVGNTVHQIDKLLCAPTSEVSKKIFYLGDRPAVNISTWANEIASYLGLKPIKSLPYWIFKIVAICGDLLAKKSIMFPMTSARLANMTIDNIIALDDLHNIVEKYPYSRQEGIKVTIEWMRKTNLL